MIYRGKLGMIFRSLLGFTKLFQGSDELLEHEASHVRRVLLKLLHEMHNEINLAALELLLHVRPVGYGLLHGGLVSGDGRSRQLKLARLSAHQRGDHFAHAFCWCDTWRRARHRCARRRRRRARRARLLVRDLSRGVLQHAVLFEHTLHVVQFDLAIDEITEIITRTFFAEPLTLPALLRACYIENIGMKARTLVLKVCTHPLAPYFFTAIMTSPIIRSCLALPLEKLASRAL